MENKPKRIPVEDMIQMTNQLQRGETVTCPLCGLGVMESAVKDVEKSHCFVCTSCGEKLNIN